MAGAKRWHADEIEFLTKNYGIMSVDDIASRLGRSVDAVHWKASEMNVKFQKQYSDKSINYLQSLERRVIILERKIKILEQRTKKKIYSKEEMKLVKSNLKSKEVASLLGRSENSVIVKRSYLVKKGLFPSQRWKQEEIDYLTINYGKMKNKIIAAELNKSLHTVYAMISRLKLNKKHEKKSR